MSDALILAPARSSTSELLAAAASAAGLQVVRLAAPHELPVELSGSTRVHLYGGPRWARAFAAALDLALLEPRDAWLPSLPRRFTQRALALGPVAEAVVAPGSFFAKPPREKTFEPAVHTSASFAQVVRDLGLPAEEPVLTAEPVRFGREYRLMVLDGQVVTGSRYLSWGVLDPLPLGADPHEPEVLAFAADVLEHQVGAVPAAFALDVGYADNARRGDEGWAVVEANMAWFSNIYACDPARALDVVRRAAGPASACTPAELAFVRS